MRSINIDYQEKQSVFVQYHSNLANSVLLYVNGVQQCEITSLSLKIKQQTNTNQVQLEIFLPDSSSQKQFLYSDTLTVNQMTVYVEIINADEKNYSILLNHIRMRNELQNRTKMQNFDCLQLSQLDNFINGYLLDSQQSLTRKLQLFLESPVLDTPDPLQKQPQNKQKTLLLFKHFRPKVLHLALQKILKTNEPVHLAYDHLFQPGQRTVREQNAYFFANVLRIVDLLDKIGSQIQNSCSILNDDSVSIQTLICNYLRQFGFDSQPLNLGYIQNAKFKLNLGTSYRETMKTNNPFCVNVQQAILNIYYTNKQHNFYQTHFDQQLSTDCFLHLTKYSIRKFVRFDLSLEQLFLQNLAQPTDYFQPTLFNDFLFLPLVVDSVLGAQFQNQLYQTENNAKSATQNIKIALIQLQDTYNKLLKQKSDDFSPIIGQHSVLFDKNFVKQTVLCPLLLKQFITLLIRDILYMIQQLGGTVGMNMLNDYQREKFEQINRVSDNQQAAQLIKSIVLRLGKKQQDSFKPFQTNIIKLQACCKGYLHKQLYHKKISSINLIQQQIIKCQQVFQQKLELFKEEKRMKDNNKAAKLIVKALKLHKLKKIAGTTILKSLQTKKFINTQIKTAQIMLNFQIKKYTAAQTIQSQFRMIIVGKHIQSQKWATFVFKNYLLKQLLYLHISQSISAIRNNTIKIQRFNRKLKSQQRLKCVIQQQIIVMRRSAQIIQQNIRSRTISINYKPFNKFINKIILIQAIIRGRKVRMSIPKRKQPKPTKQTSLIKNFTNFQKVILSSQNPVLNSTQFERVLICLTLNPAMLASLQPEFYLALCAGVNQLPLRLKEKSTGRVLFQLFELLLQIDKSGFKTASKLIPNNQIELLAKTRLRYDQNLLNGMKRYAKQVGDKFVEGQWERISKVIV
ncbi:EF-hand binding site [Hexamita inflata]|uniref:EF-hand binding site n=1 Tax=Hexamita inflata TaxID=28002 RepID=A0AA86TR75_9EUKA|nr:EF-hand binding site [Hexamita inflata]CAI9969459.1 EF-hand binding site [Hexamita inflata]